MQLLRYPRLAVAGLGLMVAACGPGDQSSALAPSAAPSPQPSLQVTGYVDDTAFRPVAGATVEVLDGPQAGTSAITDARGEFSLNSAISAETRFRAAKEGYQSSIQTMQSQPMTFFLATDRPSGTAATLTVEADPACTDLPSTVRHRTYAATVRGNPSSAPPNTTFFVDLTGASLDHYFHFVFLHADGDVVTFDMSDNGIEEEVADEAYLFVGGVASTRTEPGATTISAPLTTGMIDYCVVESDPGSAYPCTDQAIVRAQCRSPKNRLTLTWQ
jgi:Carboxypeptidase regulatory-like domain